MRVILLVRARLLKIRDCRVQALMGSRPRQRKVISPVVEDGGVMRAVAEKCE